MKGVPMEICSGSGVVFYEYPPRGPETRTIGSSCVLNQKKKRVTTDYNKTEIDAEYSRTRNIESITIEDIHDNDPKKKRVITDDTKIGLHVKIIQVVGIDNPILHPLVHMRHYNVVCWVEPYGLEFRTSMMDGFTLIWKQRGMITLENPDDHVFLNVEVQRFNSKLDPGTSSGKVVVGRARIPFPKELYREIRGSFALVRTQGEQNKSEGEITLAMRLERVD